MKKCLRIIKSFCNFSLIMFFVFVLIMKSSYGDNSSPGDSEKNITTIKICAGCGDDHKNTIDIENDLEAQNIARAKVQIIVVFLFLVLFIFLMTRPSTKIQHMIDEIDESLKKL